MAIVGTRDVLPHRSTLARTAASILSDRALSFWDIQRRLALRFLLTGNDPRRGGGMFHVLEELVSREPKRPLAVNSALARPANHHACGPPLDMSVDGDLNFYCRRRSSERQRTCAGLKYWFFGLVRGPGACKGQCCHNTLAIDVLCCQKHGADEYTMGSRLSTECWILPIPTMAWAPRNIRPNTLVSSTYEPVGQTR